jgi:hypothetical protein
VNGSNGTIGVSVHAIERYIQRVDNFINYHDVADTIRNKVEDMIIGLNYANALYPLGNRMYAVYKDGCVVTITPLSKAGGEKVRKDKGNKHGNKDRYTKKAREKDSQEGI